jgi:hypothetical protein
MTLMPPSGCETSSLQDSLPMEKLTNAQSRMFDQMMSKCGPEVDRPEAASSGQSAIWKTMKINLQNVRGSYLNLFTMTAFKDSKPSYSGSFLLAADDPQVDMVNDAIDKVAEEKWGAKSKAIVAALRAKDMVCLHNGDNKADNDGYAGMWYISARAYTKPLVIDRNPLVVVTQESGRIYSGCYVNVSLEIYAQDNDFGKRINAVLRGVQYFRAGDAFAGGAPAQPNEFSDLSDQDEEGSSSAFNDLG